MKRTWIALIIFVVYLAIVVGTALLLHMEGMKFVIFCLLLGGIGVAAFLFYLWYQKKYLAPFDGADAGNSTENSSLDALFADANNRLRQGSHSGAKSLAALPLVYIVGDENSAKTQTVLQSGLEPELLAGQTYRDQSLVPTLFANIWLTGSSAFVEAGGALLRQSPLWLRLLRLTAPARLGAAFSSSSKIPARAVVVCVSIERLMSPNTSEQIRALAQSLNERLRQLSQTLGISVPVYVLFTKIDRIPSFADYVARLTTEEVRSPLGTLLAPLGVGAGLYAEKATAQADQRFGEIIHDLSEFRLEVLSRGGEADALARGYEFPRDLRKLRQGILDFLVEVARPSQLGVNPFLRGFFFTGMRAHFVEDVLNLAAAPQAPAQGSETNATRVFSFAAQQPVQPVRPSGGGVRKVPQWVFLPHLFANILLADKSALESSRASTKVNFVKRLLLASVSALVFVYLVLLSVSYFKNSGLEHRAQQAAAIPARLVNRGDLPTAADLQALDQLRQVIIELQGYRKDGAPLSYRWGLYNGPAVYDAACHAYGSHFQRLLLGATQANILAQLRGLQSPPTTDAVYTDTYRPLKAYLITTSNPDKSTVDFLPAVLTQAWAGTLNPSADLTALAQNQFTLYAGILAEPNSCLASIGGPADKDAVIHAQDYLAHFQGAQAIYASMIAAANHKFPATVYNDKFPGSDKFIVDRYSVAGAFSKGGYGFMQDAIAHPEPYFRGEEWVLGPNTGTNVDLITLPGLLQKQYVGDFRGAWRSYLNAAHFTGYQNWKDAADKLSTLDSNTSPILELFSLVSANTAVASPDIAQSFQAPQAVVPGNAPANQFIAPGNTPYITGLQGLYQAISTLTQNPLSANDPAAAQPVVQAASQADMAAGTLRTSFLADPDGKMDTVSFNLLEAPIKAATALAAAAPAAAAGGGAKGFCSAAGPTLAKFPFTPQATDEATPEEVAGLFAPGTGALAKVYDSSLKQLIVNQGGQWVPAPGSAVPVSHNFLHFFNAAQKFSSLVFANGPQPGLDVTVSTVKDPASPPVALNFDAEPVAAPGQTTTIHWRSRPGGTFTLKSTQTVTNTGAWPLFHFAFWALHPSANRLEYDFNVNGQNKQTVRFDVGGPGAVLLDPKYMAQMHCSW